MYEEYYEKLPDKNAYLSRIGIEDRDLPATLETLNRLIIAQLTHVPFENLDVYDREKTPSLAIADLFDKVVTRRLGGYCFELNAIFMSLLEAVGFEAHAAAARVLWRRDALPPYSHRVSIVTIDGRRYYCDVGFGGPSPACAMLIDDDSPQDTEAGRFIVKTGERDTKTVFKITDEGSQHILLFTAQPFDPVDFIPLNFYTAHNETSMFRKKRIANLKTESGSMAIDGDILRIHTNGQVTETKLVTTGEVEKALLMNFGIAVPDMLKPDAMDQTIV